MKKGNIFVGYVKHHYVIRFDGFGVNKTGNDCGCHITDADKTISVFFGKSSVIINSPVSEMKINIQKQAFTDKKRLSTKKKNYVFYPACLYIIIQFFPICKRIADFFENWQL